MKKAKKNKLTILISMFLFFFCNLNCFGQSTATFNIGLTINSSLVITDPLTMAKNPTTPGSIGISPDVGVSAASTSPAFRVRTNQNNWTVTGQLSSSPTGGGISDSDIMVQAFEDHGTTATASTTLVPPFNGITDLTAFPGMTIVDFAMDSSMTSALRDLTNTNNYIEYDTEFSVNQDFFFDNTGTPNFTVLYQLNSP